MCELTTHLHVAMQVPSGRLAVIDRFNRRAVANEIATSKHPRRSARLRNCGQWGWRPNTTAPYLVGVERHVRLALGKAHRLAGDLQVVAHRRAKGRNDEIALEANELVIVIDHLRPESMSNARKASGVGLLFLDHPTRSCTLPAPERDQFLCCE